jgi:N-acetyl-gamma-glutamyl-phosphate reductase
VNKIPVGVLGASGYAGRELCALVAGHPRLALRFASANGRRGERVRLGGQDVTFVAPEDVALDGVALVFSALPHGTSAPWVTRVSEHGAHVVDLSADLRPGNGAPVHVPYGLTEVARDELTGAAVVANPGCYPTAILLALLPLAEQGLVLPGGTIGVAAASGVTGAGSSPKPELLFGEVTENYRAYAVGNGHRHLAEMRATLARWGTDADVLFTPHLLPVARGILATLTVPLARPLENPVELWRQRFANEPFVEVTDELPSLRDVVHRNVVRIAVRAAENVRQPTLVVMAAIDNLVKGAAGQALQNANRVLGLDETAGLPR